MSDFKLTSVNKLLALPQHKLKIEPIRSKILQISSSILTHAIKSAYTTLYSMSEVEDLKSQINFKYTREGIDQIKSHDLKPGSYCIEQFNLLKKMLREVSSAKICEGYEKIDQLNACLDRSEKFFYLSFLQDMHIAFVEMADSLILECTSLEDSKSFIFPTGPQEHAVLFQVTKNDGRLFIRLYNTGYGSEEKDDLACMPLFEIDPSKTDLSSLFKEILLLQKKKDPKYNEIVETIIKNHGGKRVHNQDKLHNSQDRGNCSWKSISTFFSDWVSGLTVSPNDPIFERLPQAVQDKLGKEPIPYKRVVKIFDYEALRSRAQKISKTSSSYLPFLTEKPEKNDQPKTEKQKTELEWQMRLHTFTHQNVMQRYEKKDNPASLLALLEFLKLNKNLADITNQEKLEYIFCNIPIGWKDPKEQQKLLIEYAQEKSDLSLLTDFFALVNKTTLREIMEYAKFALYDESLILPIVKRITLEPELQQYFLDLSYQEGPEVKTNFIQFFAYMDECVKYATDSIAGIQKSPEKYYSQTQAFEKFGHFLKHQFLNNFNTKSKQLSCDLLKQKTESEIAECYQKNPGFIRKIEGFINVFSRYTEFDEYKDLHKQLKKIILS